MVHAFSQACFNRREVLLRYGTAEHFFREDHIFTVGRLKSHPYIAIHAGAAILFLVAALLFCLAGNGFTILYGRFGQVDIHLVLCFQFGTDKRSVLIAHNIHHLFMGFFIVDKLQRAVFLFHIADAD